jgi:hypothetical protein
MRMVRAGSTLWGPQGVAELTHSSVFFIPILPVTGLNPRQKVRQKITWCSFGSMKKWLIGPLLSFAVTGPTVSQAGGPIHGAKAAAMGTAFGAVADDPSAILHNPAGLANLRGTNLYGGGTAVILSSDIRARKAVAREPASRYFSHPTFISRLTWERIF